MKYWILMAILALAAPMPLTASEINVFAAASLTDVLKEIAAGHEKRGGDRLVFNFGASPVLARQIQEGAPADVFISADEEKMDGLERLGLLKQGTRASLLSNSLVIVVEKEGGISVRSANDLRRAKRIAIAEPRTVPAGIYARKYLEQVGLWAKIASKVIPTENVRGALAAVESGNADAAIVYKTDAAISKKVRIAYEVPAKDAPKISYPAAALREAKQGDKAVRFLDYLGSGEASGIFEKHGFVALKRPKSSERDISMDSNKKVAVRLLDAQGNLLPPVQSDKVVLPDEAWRKKLTPEQYRIARGKGTERAFCGVFYDHKKPGVYSCVCCALPLFSASAKFDSGTGWPSFLEPIARENVAEASDTSHGMRRTEVLCARCDAHLGHVFEDGPPPTGLRYCLNSESLTFSERKK